MKTFKTRYQPLNYTNIENLFTVLCVLKVKIGTPFFGYADFF